MLYNTGHKFLNFIDEPSQEEIYNCPHYFGCSTEEIKKNGAPEFLLKILDQFPWSGRPNVCQIRPQDFRKARPPTDGFFWHCDNNVRLKNGGVSQTTNVHDFRLMSISFGGMCSTEFINTPWDLPNFITDHGGAYHGSERLMQAPFEIISLPQNQIGEYTSLDFHRASPVSNTGKIRLFFVVFESDDVRGSEWILPSVREQEGK